MGIVSFINYIKKKRRQKAYRKNWDNKVHLLLNGKNVPVDQEYENEVKRFWSQFTDVNTEWARYYSFANGIKSKYYIPSDVYFGRVCRFLNRKDAFSYPLLQDKNYLDLLFPHLIRPQTIAHCINNTLLDANYEQMSFDTLCDCCRKYDEVLIKPTIDSTGARNVDFLKIDSSFPLNLEKQMASHGSDFVIQTVLKQNKTLAELNEDSINTVRVLSLLWNDEVHILGSLVRVGVKGVRVDNLVASNGVAWAIDLDTGKFIDTGYDKVGNPYKFLPNGLKIGGQKVPGFENIIDAVKRNHQRLSHFRLIGWDYTIDDDLNPILIETNLDFPEVDFHQIATGPILGEGNLFEEVMSAVFKFSGNFIA